MKWAKAIFPLRIEDDGIFEGGREAVVIREEQNTHQFLGTRAVLPLLLTLQLRFVLAYTGKQYRVLVHLVKKSWLKQF